MASHGANTFVLPSRPRRTQVRPPKMTIPRKPLPTALSQTKVDPPPLAPSSPSYELFVATFPDRSADRFDIRTWLQIWFDSEELFTYDVGVKTFLSQIHLNGIKLRCLSREGLLKSLSRSNTFDRLPLYPETILQALLEDVEKARVLSLEDCEKEMEKRILKITLVNHLESQWRDEDERWSDIGALCWMALSGFRKSQKEQKVGEAWKYFLAGERLLRVWEKVTVRPGTGSKAEREAFQIEMRAMLVEKGLLTDDQEGDISHSGLPALVDSQRP